jgi:transposase
MSRERVLTDAQWALIEPLLPSSKGQAGRPFRDHRQVVEGILFRYRAGCPWRDLPAGFGPYQTVWKRHARWSKDGTWDQVLHALLVKADDDGQLDWQLSIDSTVSRVHQHGSNMTREVAVELPSHTGGPVELQETAGRAC